MHVVKPALETVEKKSLLLTLPYFKPIFLQVRTEIKKTLKSFSCNENMKNILNCSKLQIIFRKTIKLSVMLQVEDHVPYDSVSGVVT